MNEQQFLEYDLSEIVFSIDDENSYKETYSKISDSISKFGFKVTANKFTVLQIQVNLVVKLVLLTKTNSQI